MLLLCTSLGRTSSKFDILIFCQNKLRKIFFIRTNVSKMGYLNKRISGNYKKHVLQHI